MLIIICFSCQRQCKWHFTRSLAKHSMLVFFILAVENNVLFNLQSRGSYKTQIRLLIESLRQRCSVDVLLWILIFPTVAIKSSNGIVSPKCFLTCRNFPVSLMDFQIFFFQKKVLQSEFNSEEFRGIQRTLYDF